MGRLGGFDSQFNCAVGGVLGLVSCQSRSQCRELLIGLKATEALGCLHHGRTGPTQRHGSILPAFDIAADAAEAPRPHARDLVGLLRFSLAALAVFIKTSEAPMAKPPTLASHGEIVTVTVLVTIFTSLVACTVNV